LRIRTAEALVLAIVILSFVLGVSFSGTMPERMASHWSMGNEVDGYVAKSWGVFLVPLIMFVLFLLFLAIPRIDPLRRNIEHFRKYFEGFIVSFFLFMLYLHLLMLLWNAGHRFVMIRLLAPGFAVLFFLIGVMLDHAKQNRFVGIRTPWTLRNERVWDKTHSVGGRLFKIIAFLSLLAIPFPPYAVYLILVPVLSVALFMMVYSYWVSRAESDGGRERKV
jgi:uncharacterized membrane protein